jgi:UDP-N-acetylglucosamine--N-acetylmuramyl-(pentapeptide) pyrophosphoryl-undecaprenol N-acetylglucosamine transferase
VKKKILICGGHVTPAIALIDELIKEKSFEVVFIGRTYAAEYTQIREMGIRFLPIIAGKLHRSFAFKMIPDIAKIPVGFVQAFTYCIRERPDVVVSFGGYVALPVAIAAWMLCIPVITHEQTLAPGLANKIIATIARRVCVAFEETVPLMPRGKTVFTGLPMRKELFVRVPHAGDRPLIFITGGSQGAKSLNEKIIPAIGRLTRDYTVIHQTGSHEMRSSDHYQVSHFIPVGKFSRILQNAKIVIARSGANTTIELAALGKVAILVPLPWSAENEQLLQAKWLAARGGAVVLEQDTLTTDTILACITAVRKDFEEYQSRAKKLSAVIPRDGAQRLAHIVRGLL